MQNNGLQGNIFLHVHNILSILPLKLHFWLISPWSPSDVHIVLLPLYCLFKMLFCLDSAWDKNMLYLSFWVWLTSLKMRIPDSAHFSWYDIIHHASLFFCLSFLGNWLKPPALSYTLISAEQSFLSFFGEKSINSLKISFMHNNSQLTLPHNSCLIYNVSPHPFQTSCPSLFITHPIKFVRPFTGHSQPTRWNIFKKTDSLSSKSPELSTSLWPRVGAHHPLLTLSFS